MYELVPKRLQIIYFLFIIILFFCYFYYFPSCYCCCSYGFELHCIFKKNYIKINTDEFWSAFPHLQTSTFEICRIVLSEWNSLICSKRSCQEQSIAVVNTVNVEEIFMGAK